MKHVSLHQRVCVCMYVCLYPPQMKYGVRISLDNLYYLQIHKTIAFLNKYLNRVTSIDINDARGDIYVKFVSFGNQTIVCCNSYLLVIPE